MSEPVLNQIVLLIAIVILVIAREFDCHFGKTARYVKKLKKFLSLTKPDFLDSLSSGGRIVHETCVSRVSSNWKFMDVDGDIYYFIPSDDVSKEDVLDALNRHLESLQK